MIFAIHEQKFQDILDTGLGSIPELELELLFYVTFAILYYQ